MKNKGITLIALVITIIVMLILATVSINYIINDNGIINRSKQARDQTRAAIIKEYIELAVLENTIIKKTNGIEKTKEQVIQELFNNGKITEIEKNKLLGENGETQVNIITIGGIDIDFGVFSKTAVQAFKNGEIAIGDLVENYNDNLKNTNATITISGDKTGVTDSQTYVVDTNVKWRVLGLSEDETQLVLTTESPIKKQGTDPYLHLKGAEAWYHTNDEFVPNDNILDKICEIYDTDLADKTKSIRTEDVNNALKLIVDQSNNKLYKKDDVGKTNPLQEFSGCFGMNYIYKNGDHAPENYLKEIYGSTYDSLLNKFVYDSINGSAYSYIYTYNNIINQGNSLYKLLFFGTSYAEINSKAYWLASSETRIDTTFCEFGLSSVLDGIVGNENLFQTNGLAIERALAVRPIVFLKSGISVDELVISKSDYIVDTWEAEAGYVADEQIDSGVCMVD